ncbi:LysM peptidoglycan-binding domain-containing protein [Paludibacter sp.]|uniref:LysM peptidoglycan-binding domain-containing protein n=1 Tax=Paludibacter sp. TaxID=1898105 RepID=UPI001353DF20|nr:LysM peptidoglycan-binding domain-containing protein [Paludibacter sp.]MTK53133.1 LysM peptidoglycan-binding domain-containing protein [Paludibacter sp.]
MKYSRIFCFGIFMLLLALTAYCQELNYPVVEEHGQKFYLYTVDAKEGLYAVSHKFNVTQADILNCNPSIAEGLKAGQVIKIPLSTQTLPTVTTTRQHTVIKKQTLYSIAYQYGVTVEAIVAMNPDAAKGIKEGDVLQIPPPQAKKASEAYKEPEELVKKSIKETPAVAKEEKKQVIAAPKQTVTKDGVHHQVVAGETFYSLSRMYKVSVESIKNANPTVEVLKTGETVIIPSDTAKAVAKPIVSERKPLVKQEPIPTTSVSKSLVKVAVLLPFSLDGAKDDPTIEKFVDFYRGVLLALSDLKEKGISVDIHTYDIAKTVAGVTKVLENEELSHVDLIIGPAYAAQTKPVADFAKQHKIYTIIPFTQKVDGIATNPYLFQFNPSIHSQYVQAASLFVKQFRNFNIVIAQPVNGNNNDDGTVFAESLMSKLKQNHIAYHTAVLQGGNLEPIKPWITEGKPAIVVLATSNAEKAAPYLSAFAGLNSESKHVSLYGFLDWEPETNVYPNLYYASLFYSHDKESLADYNREYTKWFHLNPNSGEVIRFDLLGYDLSLYFISMMSKYGVPGFTQHLSAQLPENIESRFAFKRVAAGGGFQNNELHLLNYKSGKGVTLIGE